MASPTPTPTGEHADVRLLQIVHKTFRLATTRMVDASAKVEPSKLRPTIVPYWDFYAAAVHHHHHTEDTVVFPALVSLRPEFAEFVGTMEDDHKRLVDILQSAGSAVAAFDESPGKDQQQKMHDSFVAVRGTFFPHLDIEHEKAIPAFAEFIPHAQWEKMDSEVLKSLPRKYLSKAVAALDEVIHTVPEPERPVGGPPLPVRVLLALSWRKRWAEFVRPLAV